MSRLLCRHCHTKWAQHPHLLCRTCDRALGTYQPRTTTKRQCRRCGVTADTAESLCSACWQVVAQELAKLAEIPAPAPVEPTPRRERTVGHLTFWVVWDGTK